jgi:hypothetical protein
VGVCLQSYMLCLCMFSAQQASLSTMKAVVCQGKGEGVTLLDIPKPDLVPGEVLIKVQAAAMNRRDVFITQGNLWTLKALLTKNCRAIPWLEEWSPLHTWCRCMRYHRRDWQRCRYLQSGECCGC